MRGRQRLPLIGSLAVVILVVALVVVLVIALIVVLVIALVVVLIAALVVLAVLHEGTSFLAAGVPVCRNYYWRGREDLYR